MKNKSLFYRLAETYEQYRLEHSTRSQQGSLSLRSSGGWLARQLTPNLGSVLLVLLLLGVFPGLAAPSNNAAPPSISTIPYQGRLAEVDGTPFNGKQNMEFRLYDVPQGGVSLWTESWANENSVDVSDGLFSVLLGSIEPGLADVVQSHDELYLGIAVGTDSEMVPRVQLGSVPFAMTVPDNSITSSNLAQDAVNAAHIEAGAVGASELADGSVTSGKLSRTMHEVVATEHVPLPLRLQKYDVLSHTLNLEQETWVTIYSSTAGQNSNAATHFVSKVIVDSEQVAWGKVGMRRGLVRRLLPRVWFCSLPVTMRLCCEYIPGAMIVS
jgi:hypothetical protein